MNSHLSNLKSVFFAIAPVFHQIREECLHNQIVDERQQSNLCDHDANSVKEKKVYEDNGPRKNPEDRIEEKDGIVLDLVQESVGLL